MKEDQQINVEVREMPQLTVAYACHTGPYKGDSALFENLFEKLFTWAGARGLCRFPETQVLSVYHEDPTGGSSPGHRSSCIVISIPTPIGKKASP